MEVASYAERFERLARTALNSKDTAEWSAFTTGVRSGEFDC